jgi:ElaB/YqjD/DUF883 family membrane-anchored ribosome-binding protein
MFWGELLPIRAILDFPLAGFAPSLFIREVPRGDSDRNDGLPSCYASIDSAIFLRFAHLREKSIYDLWNEMSVPSTLRARRRYQKEKFMDERIGSEKLPQDAKVEFAEAAAKMQETLGAAANEARQTVKTAWHEAKRKTSDFQTMYEAYVRDKPSQALLIAFGAGFLVGLLRRR